jgi:phospholipase C
MSMNRRQVLAAAGATGLLTLAPALRASAAATTTRITPTALPDPASSGIDHIVVVCMENRSFDHFLGWLPGANGRQAGLTYRDAAGAAHATYHLRTFQGCGHPDPDHSYQGARTEYNGGACDGWLLVNDPFSIGYYQQADLPFTGRAAPIWTVCDNYYAATLGPTVPNRLYLHAAQTDRTDDGLGLTSMPTIWDRLARAGISRAYYYNDLPFLALWGLRYAGISKSWSTFLADAAGGALPAVSYVEPPLFFEAIDGLSSDDHPHGDVRNGDAFLNSVYQAVTHSPVWSRTVLVITFDEWGGFYDHVAPTSAPDTNPGLTGLRGFRVPALVISPRAHRGGIAGNVYDHTSILKLIEWRFGLAPLTPRDAAANNLAEVLDFASPPNPAAPQWSVPKVGVLPCFLQGTQPLGDSATVAGVTGASGTTSPWAGLGDEARRQGWLLPG